MLNSFNQLFYDPIKEINNFCFIKDHITFQDFISLYEQLSNIEDKISILNSLKTIFSHKNSQLNISFFNKISPLNTISIKNETNTEEEIEIDKSNYSYYSNQNNNFICWIINEYFSENNKIIRQYLNEILQLIMPVIGIKKQDIDKAYEKITKIYFYSEEENPNINDLFENIKFLSGLYGLKEESNNGNNYIKNQKDKKPYNYYFFKGKESIHINPIYTSIEKSEIKEGFSIFFCFNCVLNPKYNNYFNEEKSDNISILFTIYFNNNNKFVICIDFDMNLIIKLYDSKSYKESNIIVSKIEDNKWYNIGINFNLKKSNKKYPLTIMINNKLMTNASEIECGNILINEINNIILCENFIGFITNFILFNKLLENEDINFYHTKFKFGLFKLKYLYKFIDKINQNIVKNLIILLIPLENENNDNEIINLANEYLNNNITNNFSIKFDSSIGNNINVNINYHLTNKINLLGGIENILPFLEILIKLAKNNNKIDINIFQECIQRIIKLINIILINHKTNTNEITNSTFFEILSLFLQNISFNSKDKTEKDVFTTKIMYYFLDLCDYLLNNAEKIPNQSKSYLNNLLLNIKIITKFPFTNQNMILDFVAKHLNSVNVENLIDYENIFSVIGYYNEYYNNYLCCEEHQTFYDEKIKKIDLKMIFDSLTKIIGYTVKCNEDIYIKIIHLLVIKSKPCLIKFILKNVFIPNLTKNENSKNDKNKFVKYLVKNNILNILLFLLSTYVYPDVISQIINMFSILSVYSNSIDNNYFFNKDNIINYIANSIIPKYVRIKINEDEVNNKDNNLNLKPKVLAASEIVIPKNKRYNTHNKLSNNINSSSDEEDFDEYNGINTDDNKIKLMDIKKLEKNYRKKSDDNFQSQKFNLNKIYETKINEDDNNDNDNNNNNKKDVEYNSDSEREYNANDKNNIPKIISPRKLKSSIQNVMNFLSVSDNKAKYLTNKQSIDSLYEKAKLEFMKLTPILDKLNKINLLSFIQIILDSLLNWLKNDLNDYVLKIIVAFFKYEKIEYIHIYKFIETFDMTISMNIHNKNNTLSKKNFSLDFYFWFMDIMFQFYLKKNNRNDLLTNGNKIIFSNNENSEGINIDKIDNILKKGINILVNALNNIKMENEELIELFDDLLLCGTKIKKYYSLNKNTIIYLNNFYLELFITILKEYNKYHNSFSNTDQLIIIINICYEYMLFFNNENKTEDINNFIINDSQIFNGIILSGINTNNSNAPHFWSDYSLFEAIMNVLKQSIKIENIDYKNDKYLDENILTHKKSDTYLEQISFLCNCKKGNNYNINNINNFDDNIKNGELPLIYIISNLYVISLNLFDDKEEKIKILNSYKLFIIFLIISSSNLSYNPPFTNIIQSRVQLILNYFIGFIIERCNNGLDKDILIPCLNEVFILMIKIVKRTYDQIQNRKSSTKFLNKIIAIASAQKKIDFRQCAVFKIFSNENMANVFNKKFVTTMKKNNFKDFNDKTYLFQILISCVDLKTIKKEIKNIFFADKYIKKGHKRISFVNELKNKEILNEEDNDNCYDLQFFKVRKKISNILEKALYALEEEIKVNKEKKYLEKLKIQNNYKRIKKKLFSFNGLWSNKEIFYNDNDNNNNDELDEINENNNENENSLELNNNINKYKNKYILKYKLINHYGKIPFRPILSPIYDINSYLPCFSLFNKDNLFIEKKEGEDIPTVINLNMDEIFNNSNNYFSLINTNDNDEDNSYLSNIYQNNFKNAYNYYKNTICINHKIDGLLKSPLSGLVSSSHSCCYVIQMSHIKGYLYLGKLYCSFFQNFYNNENNNINDNGNNKKLKVDEDYDEEKKMCYGSYIKLNKSKYVYINIKYKSIKYIFLRRYYYKDSAIEIFTSKNKAYYFNFPDSFERQCTLNLLLNKFTIKKEIKILKNKLIGYDVSNSNQYYNINNSSNNLDFLSNLVDNWKDWNISTFELLLWLNILSNRSFNDLSQYPVFPWILTQYNDIFSSTPTPGPTEKKISLSKSFMPGMFKSNLKTNNMNISSSYMKSNSGDIKNKKNNFLKEIKEKIYENENNENKNEMESAIVNSNDNISDNKDKNKNNYDQFPLEDKESQIILEKDIRNFALPMGMMCLNENGEKRKNNYISKYTLMKKENIKTEKEKENKNNINNQLYIYGSHYSNPLYVCHYLTRIFPFSNISIELQGDKFDDPNRLLISVNKSFEGSSSHEGDVRELIPEFFYLPEIFINKNNLDLKIKSKNNTNKSNDVILPKWADNNKYIFITKLKTYLESEEVNIKINKWFDLIFGYKQKGKEAESAYNLFFPSSYDTFDIKNETLEQKQYFLRLIEFGLTPHQIIKQKFVSRKPKDNRNKTISESWREKQPNVNQFENKKTNDLKILKIKFIDEDNIIVILNNYQFIKYEIIQNIRFNSNSKNYIKKDKISKLNFFQMNNNKIINKSYPIIVYEKGTYIAQGGYLDGKIIVTQLNNKNKSKNSNNADSLILNTFEIINPMDRSPIIVLIISKNEKIIFSGSILGSVVIYSNKKNTWKIKSQINDHYNMPLTSIFYNDILNLWGSTSYDGYVHIYTFPSNKKISSIKVDLNGLYADYLLITSSPLPSFIIYCKNNFCFYSYSLTGKLICKDYEINTEISYPSIIKESNFGEIMIYGNDKGRICMRYLPSLNLFLDKDIENLNINLEYLEVSENGRYCTIWNNDNSLFYLIYDQSLISELEDLIVWHLANDLDE